MTKLKASDFCIFCDNPIDRSGHCEHCRGATGICFSCGEDIEPDEPKNIDKSGNSYHWKCYRTSPLTTCAYCHACFEISGNTVVRNNLRYHARCFCRAFFCSWCSSEILDEQSREKGADKTNYHSACLKEKIEIDKYVTHINDWCGRLNLMFPKAKEKILFDGGGSGEPALVTGIYTQMNAADWKLSSLYSGIYPDVEMQRNSTPPSPDTKEIVLSTKKKEKEPSSVTEIVNKMNATGWTLSLIIFDITPDEKENARPAPPSPTSRRQR